MKELGNFVKNVQASNTLGVLFENGFGTLLLERNALEAGFSVTEGLESHYIDCPLFYTSSKPGFESQHDHVLARWQREMSLQNVFHMSKTGIEEFGQPER